MPKGLLLIIIKVKKELLLKLYIALNYNSPNFVKIKKEYRKGLL